jgi:hypothetical protein
MRLLERSHVSDVGVSLFSVSQPRGAVQTVASLINPLRRHIFRAIHKQMDASDIVRNSRRAGFRQRRWPVVGTGSGEVK